MFLHTTLHHGDDIGRWREEMEGGGCMSSAKADGPKTFASEDRATIKVTGLGPDKIFLHATTNASQ